MEAVQRVDGWGRLAVNGNICDERMREKARYSLMKSGSEPQLLFWNDMSITLCIPSVLFVYLDCGKS